MIWELTREHASKFYKENYTLCRLSNMQHMYEQGIDACHHDGMVAFSGGREPGSSIGGGS